jgi:flavin reductase (DIM6/NTAB) family NADH-FMN oxidoreductase RutF
VKVKVRFSPDKRTWRPSPLLGQIVLVTSVNEDGSSNVAPKSWVSMMAMEPPLLALGCNRSHWTARNILRTGEFVVNVPGAELASTAWRSHVLPHPRTVEDAGLTPVPAVELTPPLIEECKAHLECVLVGDLPFGEELVILARIVAVSIDRAATDAPDPYAYLRMLVFLENGTFGVIEEAHRVRVGVDDLDLGTLFPTSGTYVPRSNREATTAPRPGESCAENQAAVNRPP